MKGCVALERIEAQGNQIKDTRTLEILGQNLVNIKVIYLQEFNKSNPNPVCSSSGYRKKVFEAIPKLRGLDGFREGVPMIDPGNLDDGDDEGLEYHCDEEWYNPDIYLTTAVNKDKF